MPGRRITLPEHVADELERHLRDFPPTSDGRVFSTVNGGYVTPAAVFKPMRNAFVQAGMEPVSLGDLRHTAAVLAIRDGSRPEEIQAMMGYATRHIVLQTYGDLFQAGDPHRPAR